MPKKSKKALKHDIRLTVQYKHYQFSTLNTCQLRFLARAYQGGGTMYLLNPQYQLEG